MDEQAGGDRDRSAIARRRMVETQLASRGIRDPATLAAMGLEADIRKLWAKGLRPLALGAAAFAFISLFSLTLIELFY